MVPPIWHAVAAAAPLGDEDENQKRSCQINTLLKIMFWKEKKQILF